MKLISFKKKLGLAGAISVTVGAVIGVGIFVIVGPMGAMTGAWMPAAFGAAGALAIFGTVVSVALGSTIPADGGGYFYSKTLLGRKAGLVSSYLIVIGALGSISAVSLGVGDYLRASYFPDASAWVRPATGVAIILAAWAVNALGIMASEKLQIAMVAQLASALLIVIIGAMIMGANPDFSQPLPHGYGQFIQASVMAVMSYTGFNIIGELGDEVENPRRNIPLTIMIGLGIIAFVYVGVGWVVAGSFPAAELEKYRGGGVALVDTALKYFPPWFVHYVNLAAFFGAVTSLNAVFLAVPREFTAQAEDGHLPAWIMKFNPERQTFPHGIAVVAVVGIGLVLFNLTVDIYALLCVAGLILANAFFSVGALRLFKVAPDRVADSPIPLSKTWVYPAAVISAILSIGFGCAAFGFFIMEVRKAFLD